MLRIDRRAAVAAGCLMLSACGPTPYGPPTRVIIPRGASFGEAADSLGKAGLIGSRRLFRLYGRVMGGDRRIKPGTYLLKHGTPWGDIVRALNGGRGLVNTVTIPEGYSIQQITPILARTLFVPVKSVDAAVRDTVLLARLNIPNPTLEGYLFPDTYAFPAGTTASQAVHEMVRGFETRWKPEWYARLPVLKINRNDLVTMASLVEKEARVPEERPAIAAVYYNRLRKGMLLQADPTVQYALGRHVSRVLYKDLTVTSRYNTYIHTGLPPGPIASPGAASLEAAANPADVPYLFFVAAPDGHHEFRMTLDEHINAIRQVRGLPPRASDSPARKAVARAVTGAPSRANSKTTSKPAAKTTARTPAKPTAKPTARTTSKTVAPTPKRTTVKSIAKTPARTTAKPTTRSKKKGTTTKAPTSPIKKTTVR